MSTLSIKISAEMERAIEQVIRREHLTKSELVRRSLAAYVSRPAARSKFVSALEQAGDLAGCFAGGPGDLATNPKYMRDFGKR
jgi:predicted transcriptional regulator